MELQIHHVEDQNGTPLFSVVRSDDMKRTQPVPLPSPASFPVGDYEGKRLLSELRWYLEDYLRVPYGAYPQFAQAVTEALQAWGEAVFDRLFAGPAQNWYQAAKGENFRNFRLKIASDAPEIMAWPWEALYSREDGYLALRFPIERQLSRDLGDPPPLPEDLPQDALHILYVIPRPDGTANLGYRTLAKSLVHFIEESRLPVTVDVLRPPTFDRLRQTLKERPGYYHIVHFDGHGDYGDSVPGEGQYGAAEGLLLFEQENGQAEAMETTRLAQLLAEYRIPCMVLNACQSGMVDGQARDPFACVAAGLLRAGVYSVVAMGYSLYVSAAKEFVPAFYRELFGGSKISEAVRAGRCEMYRQPRRSCVTGALPLQDWVVPVLYRQMPEDCLPFPRLQPGSQAARPALPQEAALGDYGFIGRDRETQQLERAMQRQPQAALLIHGQAGSGKTTLARGFLHWLRSTGGLQGRVFWFNFQEIHSAEYVVNELVRELADTSHGALPMEQKLETITGILREQPHLLVWDNLESASGIAGTEVQAQLPPEDLALLRRLLKRLRGGKTKALLTSRKDETQWLPLPTCFRVCLGGLEGEELWEYCNAVVRDLGLTLDRSNGTYRQILEKLCGNPLAIRAILLRLQDCTPEDLLTDLDRAFEGQAGDESTRRLQAAYAVFGEQLQSQFLPILQLTGLHEYYVDLDLVREMLAAAGEPVPPEAVAACYEILKDAGFCTHVGANLYRLHPALRGYLQQQMPAPENIQRCFIYIISKYANILIIAPFYNLCAFLCAYIVNMYRANRLAESLVIDDDFITITRCLAHYAQESRQFSEASRLYTILLRHKKIQDNEERAMVLHQLGLISQEQFDFKTAESLYNESLEISKNNGYELISAYTYHQLGSIAQNNRNFSLAEICYTESIRIKEKYGDYYGAANTRDQMSILWWERQDFSAAEDYCKSALAIWEEHGDKYRMASAYHQLGIIAQAQQDFTSAKKWYWKSLKIKGEHNDKYGAAITYHQLGRIAEEQQNFKHAETWFTRSLAIKEKQGNKQGAALTYHQLGVLAAKQKDFQNAANHFFNAIEGFANAGDKYHLAMSVRNYAWLLHAAPPSVRDALQSRWDAQMPDWMTKLLETISKKIKEDSNDTQT